MNKISEIIMGLAYLKMFKSINSVDFTAISKDHIGELEINFQDEIIQVSVYSFEDQFVVAEKVIKKASFK